MARVSRSSHVATPAIVGPQVSIPANTLRAGDTVRMTAQIVAPPVTAPPEDSAKFRSFLANSVCGIVGISGAGKTSLATTAVEEAWEVYGAISLWYAADLGGWGTQLRSLIKHGICRAWYIRNHTNPFDTMQYASMGYWPEQILDPENGFAAPDVRLIPPRVEQFTLVCANGHPVVTQPTQSQILAVQIACPECGQITNPTNASGITRALVRPALFKSIVNGKVHIVGHRVYDSMTQINEWGASELTAKSARGDLPSTSTGGSVLGSADGVAERDFRFGTGSKAQVGFMQNRTPEWIANIRAIPDQVLPATMTFGVEQSRGDDESGGMPVLGPKIQGNARTSSVPGWLGNCLYAAKEPHNPPEQDEHGNVKLYHRLWLTTHVDPRDARAIPIMAKHRGEPLGMPPFLEDDGVPEHAWKVCSLRVFYGLLRKQAAEIEARDAVRFPDAPGLVSDHGEDDVIESGVVSTTAGMPASMPSTGRVSRRSRAGAPVVPVTPVESVIDAPVVESHVTAPAGNGTPVEQSVVPAAQVTVQPPAAVVAGAGGSAPAVAPVVPPAQDVAQALDTAAAASLKAATAPPPVTAPPPTGGRVSRRTPRPPV